MIESHQLTFNSGLTNGKIRKKKKKTFLFYTISIGGERNTTKLWQLNSKDKLSHKDKHADPVLR